MIKLSFIKRIGIAMLGGIAFSFSNVQLTADQILQKAESKLLASTVIAEINVTVKRPKWSKQMTLKSWTKDQDYALAYVMKPDKDKGTVYLKNKNEVYNYLPKVKRTIKLPAALLSQNWMGTDMSTDDLIKLTKLRDDYTAKLVDSEMVSGKSCYKILLEPKEEADVLWGKLALWIDKIDYIQMKTIFYDEDLEPVNTVVASNVKNMDGKRIASKVVMTPANKSGYSTSVVYNSIKFNSPISSTFFTKENMSKVRP